MEKKRSKKKPRKSGDQLYKHLKTETVSLLDSNLTKAYTIRQLSKRIGATDKKSKALIGQVLDALEEEGKIHQVKSGKYTSTSDPQHLTGKVDFVSPRFAFIKCDELDEDIKINADHMMNALDGDTVKVVSFGPGYGGKRPEGEIVEILERGRKEYVGRIELSSRYAFVVPDNRKMHHDIFVRLEDIKGAKHNDKVIVKLVEWPTEDKSPVGKVTEILGPAGENNAEMHSILAEFGLPMHFPENIEQAAQSLREDITGEEIKKRRDFRDVTTFTIDPEEAKDFDDALSIRKLDNGHWEVGIHIADVTHYVQPKTSLEKEAHERGTSVYLVDRVVPMLPEHLSNGLCSLSPGEDKLTFSAVFELDGEANVKKEWFGKSIIHSNRRFTYEEAQERIENVEGDFFREMVQLNELALKLRNHRFMSGAINFETTEVKFTLDETGYPLGVIPRERKDAHKLVEEFMLLANRKVAEFIYNFKKTKGDYTFVYRIHDYPDDEKIKDFSVFARKFGHQLNPEEDAIAGSLNKLIEDIEGKPEENVLQSLAIRAMAKAKYTTEPKGHFGLAFDHYTHFTSPIRRYPDMMVHRLIHHYINGGKSADKKQYERNCEHSSDMERKATEAERASIKYKQVQYMESRIGNVYTGLVSGVTENGVFVELTETKCEGMVKVMDMRDDFYEYDEKNHRLIGKKRKKMITLGDEVKVKVINTDIDRRTIDLEFENN